MQEEIEAIRDAYCPSNKTEEENKKLCEKYPFLAWYGDPLYMGYTEENGPNYKYTWEDEIPAGWRKAFCPQMWDELKEILEKHNYLDEFRFVQIKEKWGTLRIYDTGAPEEVYNEIEDWEAKYEELSEKICIHCGKPAKYMSLGWICPWCEECVRELNEYVIDLKDVEEYYKTPREDRRKFYINFKEDD